MYCDKCGKKIDTKDNFCTGCGAKVDNNVSEAANLETTKKTNGLRTASIVLGIIGIISSILVVFSPVGFILSLIGLILGICSLKKGKNVLGIVLNSVGLFLSVIVLVIIVFFGYYVLNFSMGDSLIGPSKDEYIDMGNSYDFSSIDLDVLYENDIPIGIVLDRVDKIILEEMYPEDDDMIDEIVDTAEYYYDMYEQYYGYSKEEFLDENGFSSEDEFIEYLKLDYRRNKYYEEYVRNLITDEDINEYYREEVFGDVNSKHILVPISDDELSDSDAKKIANEIINKLNNGKTWDEVILEYSDKIVHEELGYQSFNDSLEDAYLEECKNLSVGEYSRVPVLTSYGYHIVYKIDQKDKPELGYVKEEIVDVLSDKMMVDDSNLYYKALIYMREEAGFDFKDTMYALEYEEYVNDYK